MKSRFNKSLLRKIAQIMVGGRVRLSLLMQSLYITIRDSRNFVLEICNFNHSFDLIELDIKIFSQNVSSNHTKFQQTESSIC